jgi:hypothetical protein
MPIPSEKKCLIILGMHRSGTSSLTGALHFTGFDIGKSIMPPADENPKGFFENTRITDLNDKILEEIFCFWSDTLFIPEGWWKEEKFGYFKDKVKDILREEFSGDKPLLIKDPRLSVVLPLYLEVFKEEKIKPVFLVCVRNPYEVASSLARRNNMPLEKSILLWMDYQLKAELYSRDHIRLFVSYSQFLKDPLNLVEIVRHAFGMEMNMDENTLAEIKSFVDPSLTHSTNDDHLPDNVLLPELSKFYDLQVNAGLRDLTVEERLSADRIKSHFTAFTRLFSGLPEIYKASLTVNYGNNTRSVLTSPVTYGDNHHDFHINPDVPVTGMILRPCNARTGLVIYKIEIKLEGGSIIHVDKFNSNASAKNAEGLMLFDTDLPKVIIDLPQPGKITQVSIRLFYHVFGIISCRKAFWRPAITGQKPGNQ